MTNNRRMNEILCSPREEGTKTSVLRVSRWTNRSPAYVCMCVRMCMYLHVCRHAHIHKSERDQIYCRGYEGIFILKTLEFYHRLWSSKLAHLPLHSTLSYLLPCFGQLVLNSSLYLCFLSCLLLSVEEPHPFPLSKPALPLIFSTMPFQPVSRRACPGSGCHNRGHRLCHAYTCPPTKYM